MYQKIVNTDKKIVFLSGVPGSGKTSAISYMNYHYKDNIIGRFYAFKPISLKDKVYNFDSENTEPRTLWEILLNQIRVKFEWIMYPYRDNIQEEYVRHQTLYRWVCDKELFDEFLNKNNLKIIDNIDVQESPI